MINLATDREKFSKSERLCSKKAIEALFENGKSFYCAPFMIVWSYSNGEFPFPAQVAISVSKRSFKLAISRNLIKRRTREAYRKNKIALYDLLTASDKKIVFAMIYRGTKISDYITIENSVKQMIKMFNPLLKESKPKC